MIRGIVSVVLLISLLPLLGVIQPGPSRAGAQNDPDIEAAVVIAHGVMPRVDGEVAWRVRPYRAALPHRSNVSVHPAGFVLADLDAIGVVGMSGKLLSRLAPGQAVWTPPGAPTAIVSLEERPVSYGEIALVPASELSGAEWELAGAPFVLPRGEAFDLNLAQGVVARGEERAVDNGIGSALLLVTSGKVRVRVETGAGDAAEVAEGEVRELDRAVTVSGAHHEPSAFVVALIAARTPAELTLRDVPRPTIAPALTPTATPSPTPSPTAVPTQTPAPTPTIAPAVPATVAISSFICPVAYDGSDYAAVCTSPSTGVEFSVSDGEAAVQTAVAGEEGYVTFDDLETGEVVVAAGVPGDFASSRVRCLNVFGEDIARRAEINQIALTLEAGDDIACDWYIVPEDARGEAPAPALVGNGSVSIHVRACPPGMTVETLDADACGEPPAGTSLSLLADGVPLGIYSVETDLWWWQNLPYRSFDLLVNAIPEGFAEASLGSRTCCNAAGGYDVLTSQETPDTGYILYLYPPATATAIPEPEAVATEVAVPESPVEVVDPDGDGLPTADEDGFFGTDPEDADSDGDGVSDVAEIAAGTDPLDGGDS